jgi:hypothetical protein
MTKSRQVADFGAGGFYAGKNKIINGDFNINQRAFSSTTTNGTFGFDRWLFTCISGTVTYSAQTFTPGTAPVAGYESKNFSRIITTGQSATNSIGLYRQAIEDVRTLAGQTATVSFWAKADSGTPKIAINLAQIFGTGGSSAVYNYAGQVTLSTSWARYSVTVTLPSISGKTISATDSYLHLEMWVSAGSDFNSRTGSLGIQSNTFDIWGVQVESGSVATPFQTATGTLQGELAACQRYYYRLGTFSGVGNPLGLGQAYSTTAAIVAIQFPVTMRTSPTALEQSGTASHYGLTTSDFTRTANSAVPAYYNATPINAQVTATLSSGLTAGYATTFMTNNASAYLGWSAEL